MPRNRPPFSAPPARTVSPTAARLQSAVQLHQTGRFAEAAAIYRQILKAEPKHFDAAQLLALAVAQGGDPSGSVSLFQTAMKLRPDDANLLGNFSAILIGLGRHAEAVDVIQRALRTNRRAPGMLNNLGVACLQLGHPADALAAFDEAITHAPDFVDAFANRATALVALKRHDEALASADDALARQPRHAAALSNRGLALTELGRPAEALPSIDAAIALNPSDADAHNNRGTALAALRRESDAIASYDRALALRPGFVRAHVNRAAARQKLKRFEDALADYDLAHTLSPNDADILNYRGVALFEMNRAGDAVISYDAALALEPDHVDALGNRGMAHLSLRNFEQGLADHVRVLQLRPDYDFLAGHQWHLRLKMCDWSNVETGRADLIDRLARGEKVIAPFASLMLNDPVAERQAAEIWMRSAFADLPAVSFPPRREGRIRIGYFSADFRDHPVMQLMAGVFEGHDRERFETFAFSFAPPGDDPVRARARAAFDHFIDLWSMPDAEGALLARSHDLDIAIDLAGFTRDGRAGLLAHRSAPVQINFLGYPGTVGADWYDYIVADGISIPEGFEGDFAEKIIRLPHTFQPNDVRPEPVIPSRAACGLPEGDGFLFCCFNNTYKITPDVFDSWIRILQRVPGSLLWLYAENDPAERNLRREAEARGLDPARLHFARRTPSFAEHLGRYSIAGLFLDTLPYNAHTTASDALWAGLPVLTRTGPTFAGRVAASVLTAAGLSDLVTHDPQAYEDLAVAIATDPQRHQQLRQRTQHARKSSLFDMKAWLGAFEDALIRIHDARA